MRVVRLLLGMSILILVGCYNPQEQKKGDLNGCSDTVATYLDLNNQLGYWTPAMIHMQQLFAGDSIDCTELDEAVKFLKERANNQSFLLRILQEPSLDTLFSQNGRTVYRAMIIDGQRPYVRMVRVSQSGQLTYKVAKYVDSLKSNRLLDDSTASFLVDRVSWMELSGKVREAYFWDLASYEFDPAYHTGEAWSLEGAITENGNRYFHHVTRSNPPISSSFRRMIEFVFNLARR